MEQLLVTLAQPSADPDEGRATSCEIWLTQNGGVRFEWGGRFLYFTPFEVELLKEVFAIV